MANLYFTEGVAPDAFAPGALLEVAGDEARHAVRVSRLRVGERIMVGDGAGTIGEGSVESASKDRFAVRLDAVRRDPAPEQRLVLVQALAKGDRDERAVEQATEFGVDAIVPWEAARSVSRWSGAGGGEKAAKGVAKWARIAREASKQSLRSRLPEVRDPAGLAQLCDLAGCDGTEVIALHPRGGRSLSEWAGASEARSAREIVLVVGPEGGFSDEELDALEAAGAHARACWPGRCCAPRAPGRPGSPCSTRRSAAGSPRPGGAVPVVGGALYCRGMSERTEILRVLRTLPGVLLVPPGRELFMQDEVHDEARRRIAEQGLPADHPYIGWHSQAEAFARKGELRGPQRVYFGGDRAAVARGLAALEPLGIAVLGGRSDGEAFALRRDARPAAVDVEHAEEWAVRLAVLGDELCAPLREGEAAQLHAIVAHEQLSELMAPDLLTAALRALRLRDELDERDLSIALSPERLSRLGSEASPIVVHALRTEHPMARDAVSGLAAAGRADMAMLTAWGGPEALEAAHAAALAAPQRIPREYLALVAESGGDPIEAGLALAEEIRARGLPAGDAAAEATVSALVELYAGGDEPPRARLVADPRCPLWLRLVAVEQSVMSPSDPAQDAARRTHRPETRRRADPSGAWLDTVDAVRREAGLPPSPGFDVRTRMWQQQAVEQREFMISRHLEGLRAALRDPELDEPAVAVLLDLLHGAGELDADTLDTLLVGWRKRLLVKPDTYTPAPPAVVVLAVALSAAAHPRAREVVDAIMGDRRAWAERHRRLLRAGLDWGPEGDAAADAELAGIAESGGDFSGQARLARVMIRARLRGIAPERAACELAAEPPQRPRYVPLGYASNAVELADRGVSRLRGERFAGRSPRALRTALRLASDDSLPLAARRHLLHLVGETSVLDHPLERCAAVMPLDEIERLRATIAGLAEQLAT